MKEKWANSLKQRMAGFEQPVDDALWAGIAQASATTGIRWWPWVSAAIASAAAVITVVLLSQKTEPAIQPVIEPLVALEEEPVTDAPLQEDTPTSFKTKPVRLAQSIPTGTESAESFPPEIREENTEDINPTIPIPPAENISPNVESPEENGWADIIAEEPAPQRNRVKITTSLYAQASPFGNRYSEGPARVQDYPEDHPVAETDPAGEMEPGDPDEDDTKALGRPMKQARTEQASASPEWTHAFPLQIGARVSLSWSERWSIDSGLTFMHFTSWNAASRQNMEFFGIPLYVNYTIGSARNFSFYASAGGQAFKCFAGNSPDKPWLFSCGLGAGAEYHISPLVSLYVQPGVDWYFHTGESRHYYTENPFAFSLSVGFRFHLL